tara:strand:+ start:1469 stop:2089 length:621 start_codon:yes stop_codon:yes gene_type:complete
MATTSNWDSDTSTGGKGFSRWYVNDSGTWDRLNGMQVYASGEFKRVRKAWTNVSGTWKPIMWHPELNEVIDLGTLTFRSRDNSSSSCQGWFKFVGGDLTSSSSWESRVTVSQASGGFSSDTGWVSGMADASANQARGAFKLPHPTDYNSGGSTYASEYGACTPVLHGGGSHSGSYWVVRACYCNTDLSKSETSASSYNPWGYTVFS